MKKINVAIDGFSSCGKSTLAKSLAKKLNYVYVDTGAMYRSLTLFAMRKGLVNKGKIDVNSLLPLLDSIEIDFIPIDGKNLVRLNGEIVEDDIRKMNVSKNVSQISTIPEVRKKMQAAQKKMASQGGVVMDGRDIGTRVIPQAELKIFMTASPDVRAKRRYDELKSKGETTSLDEVTNNLATRDKIDSERAEDPLTKAEDAYILDNTDLNEEEQLETVLSMAQDLLR